MSTSADLSLLSDARLVWAMVCDCDCKACQALDVVIQKILGQPPSRADDSNEHEAIDDK
jgi:hypothetical protein